MGETVHIQHSVVIDRAAVAGLREEEIGPQATADEADNRRRDDDERKGRLEEEDGDEGGRRDGVEGAVLQRASADADHRLDHHRQRSEEHTSELQSLMRISYAVFCLKKKITL